MTNEPVPCPFCGSMSEIPREHEEGCFLRMWADSMEDWYFAGCGTAHEDFDHFNAWEHKYDRHSNEEMLAAYNTRYKRTCHIVIEDKIRNPFESFFSCSECGARIQNRPYCSNCGCEVVADGD